MKLGKLLIGLGITMTLLLNTSVFSAVIDKVSFISDTGEELELEVSELQSRLGEELNSEHLINDVNNLKNNLPQFQNIVMSVNPLSENGDFVELIFEFQVKRTIQSIRILSEGDLEIPLDLRQKLRLQRHGVFDSSDLERDKLTIADYFVHRGYPETTVEHELLSYGNMEEVELTLKVKPNSSKLVVKKLRFKGNDSFESLELRKQFKAKPRSFFLSRHTIFSFYQLQKDITSLNQFYIDNGFLDVSIKYDYQFDEKGNAEIDVHINEGRRYKIKDWHILHNNHYDGAKIKRIYNFSQTEFYNDKELRVVLQKVREFFGERGHAKVEVLSSYDSVNERVILRVNEGPLYRIDEVVVEGNEGMEIETILLDVDLEVNQDFNSKLIEKTIKKMRGTGYYEDVRIDFEPTSEDGGKIVILVKEARTRTISFGAGTGSNGLMGELSFQDRNFLNTGKSVSLHLKKMSEMNKIGLVYRDPHLLKSDYALSLSANYTDQNNEDYQERKIGATLMVEKRISDNLKVGLGTRIEFLNLSEIDEEIRLADHNADGEDKILGMVGTLFYKTETKDSAGDTKDGVRVHMALLPSYSDQGAYIKAFSTVMATTSLWENEDGVSHSITGRLTVGYASENAPFHEKFFAGGVGTLRGFKRGSIKAEEGDGGQMLLSGSAGYSFPIWENKVKGVLFLEAASVGDELSDLGNIRTVGGLGVKANLMDTFLGSMIEVGVAIPLKKENGDELKPFYFIFGDYDPAYDL